MGEEPRKLLCKHGRCTRTAAVQAYCASRHTAGAPVVARELTKRLPMTRLSEVKSRSGMTANGSCTLCKMLIHWLSTSSYGGEAGARKRCQLAMLIHRASCTADQMEPGDRNGSFHKPCGNAGHNDMAAVRMHAPPSTHPCAVGASGERDKQGGADGHAAGDQHAQTGGQLQRAAMWAGNAGLGCALSSSICKPHIASTMLGTLPARVPVCPSPVLALRSRNPPITH